MAGPILPMPGDPLGPDTVIASCWTADEPEENNGHTYQAVVVVLHPQYPYYGVVQLECEADQDDWQRVDETNWENIISAAQDYERTIGGL